MKTRIKVHGFLIFLAVVSLAIFHKHLLPDRASGSARMFFDILGLCLFLTGYFLRVVARGYKASLNPDGKTLVTKGPYAITRNPMYLGTLAIGIGIILLVMQWWVAVVFLTLYLMIYIPQIKKEEKKLSGFFPDTFKDYCRLTPRFFPSARSLLQPDARIKFQAVWIKKEFSSFAAAAIFLIAVKGWELLRG